MGSEKDEKRDKKHKSEKHRDKKEDEYERMKKLEKKRKKEMEEEEMKKNYFGYTNDKNPFGDQNLTAAFVWGKKKKDNNASESKEEAKARQEKARMEIERVKKRREDRELEKVHLQELKLLQERAAVVEDAELLDQKEEEFHINQAQIKSELRIVAGRERPVDLYAKNLHLYTSSKVPDPNLPVVQDVEILEPYVMFELTSDIEALENIKQDIGYLLGLGAHDKFWHALTLLCDDEISKLKNSFPSVLPSVQSELSKLLLSKSTEELSDLRESVQAKLKKMNSSNELMDSDFWEYLLRKISVFEARVYIRNFHVSILRKRLSELKSFVHTEEVKVKIEPELDDYKPTPEMLEAATVFQSFNTEDIEDHSFPLTTVEELEVISAESAAVNYSPVLIPWSSIDISKLNLIDPEEDMAALHKDRINLSDVIENELVKSGSLDEFGNMAETKSVPVIPMSRLHQSMAQFTKKAAPKVKDNTATIEDALIRQELLSGMGEGESGFGVQINVAQDSYSWQDKYRPRKPRFFNRVKTGFEWNKYNQTHYDHENPPPKHVMGYKFNIFYPDLIDSSKTPFYILEGADSPDFCIIRFTAGAPYEDIAFKIVNREWDYDPVKGKFKCTFDHGVFSLFFSFRKYRWRR